MIEVLHPGLFTTVQDGGRHGQYGIGMPPSGALDDLAFRAANLLVGNPEAAAVLELTFVGPRLRFTQAVAVAVTGAAVTPRVDGEPAGLWESFCVPTGAVLDFERMEQGARGYLAVSGGIDVPVVLNSRSTYTAIGLGGLEGRPLRKGDVLAVGPTGRGWQPALQEVPSELRPALGATVELRAVAGPFDQLLASEAQQLFFDADWIATPAANRVGYRYRGPRLDFVPREPPFGAGSDPSNVVDMCYPVGSVQVPAGEEVIVLLDDAVTGGGYATIATVISADRDKIAQTRPGQVTRFVRVTHQEALSARADRAARLDHVRRLLQQASAL